MPKWPPLYSAGPELLESPQDTGMSGQGRGHQGRGTSGEHMRHQGTKHLGRVWGIRVWERLGRV